MTRAELMPLMHALRFEIVRVCLVLMHPEHEQEWPEKQREEATSRVLAKYKSLEDAVVGKHKL